MNSSKTLGALALLAAEPERAALFLDVDGVLAPIVQRPKDAQVPAPTRAELRRLVGKYALVACVSGRAGRDAERIVGVPGITYVGNHGLELAPEVEAWVSRLQQFLAEVDWARLENKGLTAALHYRDLEDQKAARAALEEIATRAREQGFATRFGRMVLEILPPIRADKGTAIRALLDRYGLERALVAGDDTTDLDSFAAVEGLELRIRVAVASDEGPQELRAAADLVVEDPEGFLEILRGI